jgi:small-conductance mechanosensitive channel
MRAYIDELVNAFVVVVPQVVGAITLAVVGLVLAVLARRVTPFMLRRLRFDQVSESAGIAKLMREGGIRRTPSQFAGAVVFYAVLALAIIAALGPLGLDFLAATVNKIILYAPRALVAVLTLVLGSSAANFLAQLADRGLPEVGVNRTGPLRALVRFTVIFVSVILAAAVLGIDVTILIVVTVVGLGGVVLAAALALGLGLRGISQNVAASRYISEGIAEGDEISLNGISGTVERIGYAMTTVRSRDGRVFLVPNSQFLEHVVEKQASTSEANEEGR